MPMNSWHPFKVSLLFGVPMFAAAVALQFINPQPMDNLFAGFRTPVLAFEFMQQASETAMLFNVPDAVSYRNDFQLGNTVDYLFMFFYSVFLGFTAIGAIRETGERVLWLAVVLCMMVFFADMLENLMMETIVNAWFGGEDLLPGHYGNLRFFTWLKWGGLSAVFLMLSGFFLRGRLLGKVIFGLIVINFGLSVAAYFHRSVLNEFMALSIVLLFLLVFVHNLVFRPGADSAASALA